MNPMGRSSGRLPGAGIRSNDTRRPGSICTNGRPPWGAWFVSPPAVLAFLVSWCQRATQRGQACGSVPKKRGKGGRGVPSHSRARDARHIPLAEACFHLSQNSHHSPSLPIRPASPTIVAKSTPSTPSDAEVDRQAARDCCTTLFYFLKLKNHGRRQVPLRTAGADRRACACDGADDGRPDFARRVPRSWPSIAPNAARPSCRLGDQLTNTSSPHRIHQGRRQAHLREPPYILPRRRARTDTRHPARAAAGRTILLVAGRGHVGDVGRLLALHG